MSDIPQGPGWWQAADGKWYAPQPPPGYGPPPQGWQPVTPAKRRKWPWIVGAVVVLLVVAAAAGGNSSNKTGSSSASPGGSVKGAPAGIGTPVKSGPFEVTAVSVNDPFEPANQFAQPQPGNRIVRVELNVQNTSGDQQIFSIILALNIRDAAGGTYPIGINDIGGPVVDGPVPANGTNHGFVTFQVPKTATGLQLQVKADLIGTAQLIALS